MRVYLLSLNWSWSLRVSLPHSYNESSLMMIRGFVEMSAHFSLYPLSMAALSLTLPTVTRLKLKLKLQQIYV